MVDNEKVLIYQTLLSTPTKSSSHDVDFSQKQKTMPAYEHIVSLKLQNSLVELELSFQFLTIVGTLRIVVFQSADINSRFGGKSFLER